MQDRTVRSAISALTSRIEQEARVAERPIKSIGSPYLVCLVACEECHWHCADWHLCGPLCIQRHEGGARAHEGAATQDCRCMRDGCRLLHGGRHCKSHFRANFFNFRNALCSMCGDRVLALSSNPLPKQYRLGSPINRRGSGRRRGDIFSASFLVGAKLMMMPLHLKGSL